LMYVPFLARFQLAVHKKHGIAEPFNPYFLQFNLLFLVICNCFEIIGCLV
jgi:hypothetical protein